MASPSNNLLLVTNLLQVTNSLQVLNSLEVPNDLLGPLGTVGTPTFSPAAGTYTGAQSVTIACANATVIYYTTDGSTPTNPPTGTSTLYTGAITVSVSETLQAVGGASDWNNSAVGSAAYTINSAAMLASVTATEHINSGVSAAVNTTNATLLVAVFTDYTAYSGTLSDSQGNTWNELTQYGTGGNPVYARCGIMYAYSKSGGALSTSTSHTFTLHPAAGEGYVSANIYAFSGTLTTSAVYDNTAGTVGSNGPLTSPFQIASITPTVGDIVIVGWSSNAPMTSGSVNDSFATALINTGDGNQDETTGSSYLIVASGSAINPTVTTNATNCCGTIACFKTS